LENSTEYHAEDSKFLEVTPEEAGGIETLLHEYPKFIPIDDLPLDTDAEKVGYLCFYHIFFASWRKSNILIANIS
jgi:hypothetical protein